MQGSMKGGSPLSNSSLRKKLFDIVSKPNTWAKRTVKARKNALASMLGLEPVFTPNLVCETLRGEGDNIRSVCTGRDGRVLWVGKTKLTRYPDVKRKFTPPRLLLGVGLVQRLNRVSSLLSTCAERQLTAKSVRPLVRLSAHAFRMGDKDLKGLCKCIKSTLVGQTEVRRPTGTSNVLLFKPRVLREEKKPSPLGEVQVPLWNMVPR